VHVRVNFGVIRVLIVQLGIHQIVLGPVWMRIMGLDAIQSAEKELLAMQLGMRMSRLVEFIIIL